MRASDKHVLLVCSNDVTASHLTVSIRIWGYRVVQVTEVEDAEKILGALCYDLVLLLPPRDPKKHEEFSATAQRIEQIQTARNYRTRLFDATSILPDWMAKGVVRITAGIMSAEVLRRGIYLALARKRGPRKIILEAKAA